MCFVIGAGDWTQGLAMVDSTYYCAQALNYSFHLKDYV